MSARLRALAAASLAAAAAVAAGCGGGDADDDLAPVAAGTLGPVGTLLLEEASSPTSSGRVHVIDSRLGAAGYGLEPPASGLLMLTLDGTALLSVALREPQSLTLEAWWVRPGARLERWAALTVALLPGEGLPEARDVFPGPDPARLLFWLPSGRWIYLDIVAGQVRSLEQPSLATLADEGGPWPPWSPDGSHFLLRHDRVGPGTTLRWLTLYREGLPLWSLPYEQPLRTAFAPSGHWIAIDGGWKAIGAVGRQAAFGGAQGRWLQLYHVLTGAFAVIQNAAVGPWVHGDPLPWTAGGGHLLREPLVAHAGLLAVDATVAAGTATWDPIELSPVAEHLRGDVVATLPGADALLAAEPAYCTQTGPDGLPVDGVCRTTLHRFRLDGPGLEPLATLDPVCPVGAAACPSGLRAEDLAAPQLSCAAWATGELLLSGGVLDPVSGLYTPIEGALGLLSPDCSARLVRTPQGALRMQALQGDAAGGPWVGSLQAVEASLASSTRPLDWR